MIACRDPLVHVRERRGRGARVEAAAGAAGELSERSGRGVSKRDREDDDIRLARQRERNRKHWLRYWKVRLILAQNPGWEDLYYRLS